MKKIKFSHLNSDEKKQITVLSIVVVLTCIILFGTSYAWFVVNVSNQKTTRLVAGTLDLTFDDTDGGEINLTDEVPRSDEEGLQTKGYTFKVQNVGNIETVYTIFIDDVDLINGESRLNDEAVKYSLIKNNKVVITDYLSNLKVKVLDSATLDASLTDTYTLKLWLDENNFNSNATNKVLKKKLRIEARQVTNKNIIRAYTYNQTEGASNYCITGEESTCQETACYSTREVGSCKAGTIIQYRVNDTETIPFHVMFDEGNKLTMQSQQDTVSNIIWAESSNANGPTIALTALEEATKNWKNVNDQTYTMGTTVFKENPYTTCNVSNETNICSSNGYILPERTAKARMITTQETNALECTGKTGSCAIWLHNYMADATKYSGTKEGESYSYWTMNSSNNTRFVTGVTTSGYVNTMEMISSGLRSIRAVIEISK